MFDGMVARKMTLNEEAKLFGVQLDSIVDIVSFGVAPVMITFHLGFNSPIDYFLLIFYTCCATMRLAYFNIHGTSGEKNLILYRITCYFLSYDFSFGLYNNQEMNLYTIIYLCFHEIICLDEN